MTYPIISLEDGRKIREEILATFDKKKKSSYPPKTMDKNFKNLSDLIGDAPCIDDRDLGDLYQEAEEIRHELIEDGVLDKFASGVVDGAAKPIECLEELFAPRIYALLKDFPHEALHDPRFWRYLALFPFRWLLCAREPELQDQDFGGVNGGRYLWLLVRAYQWGRKSALDNGGTQAHDVRNSRRAHKLSDGYVIDFFHSWVIRSRWCDMNHVSRAFISSVTTPQEVFDSADDRQVSKLAIRVGQVNNNICLNALTHDEVLTIVDIEKEKVLAS